MEKIHVSGPWITQREIDYVTDAVTNAWYSQANMYHERFERAFAQYVGRKHAMAVTHCTAAIHLSLLALGVGAEDEVIVPDATWIASAAPIRYVGARTVFADVDPVSWCLDVKSVEALITPRTRAILAVDLYGGMPDLPALEALARRHNLALIEDAAESIGSIRDGRHAGNFGIASVFSFHGSKTLTTGEGGMLVTDDDALLRRAATLRDHGRPPGDRMFFNTEVAYKYKMSSMQAALGLGQIERVEELVERKRAIFGWYRERLGRVPGLTLNAEIPQGRNSYWMVTALAPPDLPVRKEDLMARLSSEAIDSRPFFHPLTSLPAYENEPGVAEARARNVVSYDLGRRGLNLPCGLDMTEEKVERVCRAYLRALGLPTSS